MFHTLIEPNSGSAEDNALKPCIIPENSAIKRLKYVPQEFTSKRPLLSNMCHNCAFLLLLVNRHLNSVLKDLMQKTKRRRETIELLPTEGREGSHSSKPKRQKILNVSIPCKL